MLTVMPLERYGSGPPAAAGNRGAVHQLAAARTDAPGRGRRFAADRGSRAPIKNGITLKDWFVHQAKRYLDSSPRQLTLGGFLRNGPK